jgi:hypothetical protein
VFAVTPFTFTLNLPQLFFTVRASFPPSPLGLCLCLTCVSSRLRACSRNRLAGVAISDELSMESLQRFSPFVANRYSDDCGVAALLSQSNRFAGDPTCRRIGTRRASTTKCVLVVRVVARSVFVKRVFSTQIAADVARRIDDSQNLFDFRQVKPCCCLWVSCINIRTTTCFAQTDWRCTVADHSGSQRRSCYSAATTGFFRYRVVVCCLNVALQWTYQAMVHELIGKKTKRKKRIRMTMFLWFALGIENNRVDLSKCGVFVL